jgi:PAS domain S-box-containing protein
MMTGDMEIQRNERKWTEDSLHESEHRYRLLFREMVVGFALLEVIYDENGKPCDHRYLEVNSAFETHSGLTGERVVGKTIREALPGLDPFWIETYGRVATTGESVHFENYAQPLDRWLEVTAFRVCQGQVGITFTDVSERKRAEEAHKRLAAVVESSDDAIIGKTLDGTITSWNRGAEAMFGYTSAEAVGRPAQMLIPPERTSEEPGILLLIGRGESVEHFETVRMRKDGKAIDVSVTISPIQDNSGAIVGALKIARDITERKRVEQALKESMAKNDAAFKKLADIKFAMDQHAIVAVTDLQGTITYVNEKFSAITGYSKEEAIGQNYRMVNSGYHPKELFQQMYETIGKGRVWRGEIRNRAKGGSIFWVDATIVPLLDAEGKPLQYITIRTNISERKQVEERLADKAKELTRSNQELEQFAYVASHDLQEPLRMVASYTQLLSERYSGKLDQDADKFLNYAREGALRMQVLIRDLMAFSQVPQTDAPRKRVDCNLALEDSLQSLTAAIEESGAVVTHAALPNVWADQTQIAQVFQNLIGNAIKFHNGAPPECAVRAEKMGANWLFSVSDNGIGIAPEYAENIFVVFRRLHARSEFPGNGIGLAVCKKIVEHYGGTIWVESKVGEGSTFRFTLPAAVSEAERRAQS